jgi:hypothetical protein
VSEDITRLLLDARYELILSAQEEGNDSELIDMLDYWLEKWLYKKDDCPVCGKFDFIG